VILALRRVSARSAGRPGISRRPTFVHRASEDDEAVAARVSTGCQSQHGSARADRELGGEDIPSEDQHVAVATSIRHQEHRSRPARRGSFRCDPAQKSLNVAKARLRFDDDRQSRGAMHTTKIPRTLIPISDRDLVAPEPSVTKPPPEPLGQPELGLVSDHTCAGIEPKRRLEADRGAYRGDGLEPLHLDLAELDPAQARRRYACCPCDPPLTAPGRQPCFSDLA
jgi:hypothetical protein